MSRQVDDVPRSSGPVHESRALSLYRAGAYRTATICGVLSATAIVLMTSGIAIDVLLRTISGHGLTGVIEAVDPILVCVAFFALSVTELKGEHVALTMVTDRIKPAIRYALIAFGVLLCIVFTIVLLASGAFEAIQSSLNNEIRAGVVRIPLWPARIAVALGAFALLLQFIVTLIDALRSAKQGQGVGVWRERESATSQASY